MRRFLVPALLAVGVAAVSAGSPNVRKDPIGVYGLVDSVVVEPAAENPERIQLWGVFALANTITLVNGVIERIEPGAYHPPARGYLYYALNPGNESVTRAEWAEIKALAGTGEPVAFGSSVGPPDSVRRAFDDAYALRTTRYNGRVRPAREVPVQPDTFPLRLKNVPATVRAKVTPRVTELLRAKD